MPHAVLLRTAAATALAALAVAGTAPAHAATEGVPADLAVTLSGPATGEVGGTGDWTIGVANTGTTDAFRIRVELVLPQDITVGSVGVTDDWVCVLTPDLSCETAGELPAGEAADPIPVELAYGPASAGTHELAALAHQEEGARVDRATATLTVSGASPSPTPSPSATTASPSPTTATAAPVTTGAPAAVTPEVSETPPPADDTDLATVEEAPDPALDEPAALPFAVDEPTDEPPDDRTEEPADDPQAAAAPSSSDGVSPVTFALLVVVALLVLAEAVLFARLLRRRFGPG